jgi:uncharacterized protein YwqG
MRSRHVILLLVLLAAAGAAEPRDGMADIDLARIGVFGAELGGRINALKRNCILLRQATAAGNSRLGGMPSVAGFAWPLGKDAKPMSFIGQFDLKELNADGYLADVPASGALLAFYDAEQNGWGFDPKETDYFRLAHVEAVQGPPMAAPATLPKEAIFQAMPLQGSRTRDWPDLDALANHGIALTENQRLIYTGLLERIAAAHGGCKLGGYPNAIQGDMPLECQLVTHGLYCGDGSGYADPRRRELEKGAKEWGLLLQIDSCDEIGMMWGDAGMLYYWMRDADLKARKWGAAWLISQCY